MEKFVCISSSFELSYHLHCMVPDSGGPRKRIMELWRAHVTGGWTSIIRAWILFCYNSILAHFHIISNILLSHPHHYLTDLYTHSIWLDKNWSFEISNNITDLPDSCLLILILSRKSQSITDILPSTSIDEERATNVSYV